MTWEHAKGPLLFTFNDSLDTAEYVRLLTKLDDAFSRNEFNDRERDHYYGTGEIYDNEAGTRKEFFEV